MLLKPIRILVDIDGVLADFALAFTQTAVDLGMLEKAVSYMNHQSYDMSYLGLTHKQTRQVWSVIDGSRWWWLNKPRTIIRREQMAELDEFATFNECYFVTNRYGGHPNVQHQTQLWLKALGIYRPNVITTNNKGKIAAALRITHSIEDKTENANDICGKSFLLDRKYNQLDRKPRVKVIKTIDEFFKELKKDGACGTNKN
jgi:hypothetical protein